MPGLVGVRFDSGHEVCLICGHDRTVGCLLFGTVNGTKI